MTKNERKILFWIFIAVMVVLLYMLVGCSSTKKAFERVQRSENIGQLAKVCVEKFPPKDCVLVRERIIFDTLWVGDVVFDTLTVKDTVRITKTLPAKVITKTVEKKVEVLRENTAKVTALNEELKSVRADFAKCANDRELISQRAEKFRKQRNKAFAWWLIVVGLGVGYLFRGKIFNLIKKFI